MTVREAVEKAFGQVPADGEWTCHLGTVEDDDTVNVTPAIDSEGWSFEGTKEGWMESVVVDVTRPGVVTYSRVFGPDISDRPAEAFLGFFGDEYDAVVAAGEVVDFPGVPMPSTEMDSDAEELGY